MRNFLAYSLNRHGTDHVDVYRPAWLDPAVPIEETIGAIAEQVEAGDVRYIGLSEGSTGPRRRREHRSLPDQTRIGLALLDHRRSGNGTGHLHHRVR